MKLQAAEDDEIDLLQLFGTLWRGKLIIAFCAMVTVLIGGYYAFVVAVPKYSATTTLALQLRNEQVVDIESVVSGVSTETSAINTELEVIRSRGLLQKLVTELNLTDDPEFNSVLRPAPAVSLEPLKTVIRNFFEQAKSPEASDASSDALPAEQATMNRTVGAVRSAVSASNQRNTYVFSISAKTENPMKSARIANTLAELYIQDQVDVKFQATENAVTWLSERVVELEAELEAKENQIKDARARMDLTSVEALEALNQQARDVRDRLGETRANTGVLEARLSRFEELRAAANPAEMVEAFEDPTLDRLVEDAVAGDESALRLFESRYDLLTGRVETNLNRARQQADALAASLARLESDIESQSAGLVELQQLERDTEATRTLYQTFLTRLKETSVQRGLQQADSRVLSEATPGTYVEPRKSRILALSMILGVLLGAGLVLSRQFLHTGFRVPEELGAQTGHMILGQIPRIPIRRRNQLIDYLNDKPISAASEAIRNLRTSILLTDVDNPPQIIMSTSSIPGEGKTTQAVSIAHNLAGLGKKVLLVEGDIRRRTFGEYFNFDGDGGGIIAAMTSDTPIEELILRDPRIDVDVLMGEPSRVNAADLFSSDRFKAFLDRARQAYDFIIIDTPPVLVVPDARIIGQSVDAIMFTVAWDKTTRTQVSDALRQFSTINLHVTGLVLAQIDPKGMKRYGYGGSYGAYAKYGTGYYHS
ncbi:polysaccharide biosynthesis tyrosine autokinase [Aestuariicoccus sp. MJ-SS9]|nr:polysaccharide biosynthesis tyrosine autokinase [Aestuariicoccus sp. MJ-SS9]